MMRPILFAVAVVSAAATLTAFVPAFAQEAELPVDPYTQSNANAGAAPFADDQLFKAFRDQPGVARVVDGMIDRSAADPRTADIFKGVDLVRLRRTLKEQFCYLLAGPCDYTGRDMKAVHKDMGLQTTDFNILVEHLQDAMDKEGVPFRAQNRLLAKLAPMHRDVVTR